MKISTLLVSAVALGSLAWLPGGWEVASGPVQLQPTHLHAVEVAQADPTSELDALVDRVQTYYDGVEDYHADFTQEFTNLTLGDVSTSSGHVYFRKPGMMRWDYASPERYMIRDGADLWIYEPDQGQYYTQPMDESDLPTALRFLMGEGQLRDAFDVSAGPSRDDGMAVLALAPHDPTAAYAQLQFVVDPATGAVLETIVLDAAGNMNRLIFTDAAVNVGLPESGFQFTPPEGAHQIASP